MTLSKVTRGKQSVSFNRSSITAARQRLWSARIQPFVMAAIVTALCPWPALAQQGYAHPQTSGLTTQATALIQTVREATAQFQDPAEAVRQHYFLKFGCVSGPDSGAMGLHYVNDQLVGSGVIDARHPQIVIYEPAADGTLKLIGADFLVIAEQWDSDPSHHGPPELMGQLFHYFEAPNRFGLPAFYTLHVWAWKDNPNGAFVNWHPDVNCSQFNSPGAR
jgi:hypothetical protein